MAFPTPRASFDRPVMVPLAKGTAYAVTLPCPCACKVDSKSTFSTAIKVFVDTALPDPTLPPRVASPDTDNFICRIYY